MYVRIDLLRALLLKEDKTHVAEQIFKLKEKFVTSSANLIRLICDIEAKKENLKILDKLKRIKTLQIVPLNMKTVEKAVKYKEKYKLSIFDTIDVATCLELNEKLLTFESEFDKIPGIKRVNPFELIKPQQTKKVGFFSKIW
jgi:predicted nucleic acid-binding protein